MRLHNLISKNWYHDIAAFLYIWTDFMLDCVFDKNVIALNTRL